MRLCKSNADSLGETSRIPSVSRNRVVKGEGVGRLSTEPSLPSYSSWAKLQFTSAARPQLRTEELIARPRENGPALVPAQNSDECREQLLALLRLDERRLPVETIECQRSSRSIKRQYCSAARLRWPTVRICCVVAACRSGLWSRACLLCSSLILAWSTRHTPQEDQDLNTR